MEKFNVLSVGLDGTNMIEASAGTGKTYSLAILALRLITERSIPISQILMVTFTNAAMAELEVRIRKFIREAYRYSVGGKCSNETIRAVIEQSIRLNGEEAVRESMRKAVTELDETNVMTIHSFCQRTLKEYPFETGQPDRIDILGDISDIRDQEINEFWRRQISTLDPETLVLLVLRDQKRLPLTKAMIAHAIDRAINGRTFMSKGLNPEVARQAIPVKIAALEICVENYENHIRNNFNSITERGQSNHYARNFLTKNCQDSAEGFILQFRAKSDRPQYFLSCFQPELELLDLVKAAEADFDETVSDYRDSLINMAIETVLPNISKRLKKLNLATYDDLITRVYSATVSGNRGLADQLNKKFKAVFIDEFQDTDKLQYEIFNRIFDGHATLFFIGDPKQSIFGWRKADLDTYIGARSNVTSDRCFSMDRNYRSTSRMLLALNHFFLPVPGFNAFSSSDILYRNVDSTSDMGDLLFQGQPVHPITIAENENQDGIIQYVCSEVKNLLTGGYFNINEGKLKRPIIPSDIALLVRTGKQGKEIKRAFAKIGIPAVTVDDVKVLESDEVKSIRKIMASAIRPNRRSINSLLADDLFGFDLEKLQRLNDEKLLEIFTQLRKSWLDYGVYNMLSLCLRKFGIIEDCLSREGTTGQRALTNFFQIMEILHDEEAMNKYKPEELYAWLGKATRIISSEDESMQRIESDENAVRIMTIHKCKGLTFNIVFAPFLDFYRHPADNGIEFKDNDGNFWFTYSPDEAGKSLWAENTTRENKRLIYVALTRAVYKTYINSNGKSSGIEMLEFFKELRSEEVSRKMRGLVEIIDADEVLTKPAISAEPKPVSTAISRSIDPNLTFVQTWDKYSFSSLSRKHEVVISEALAIEDDYSRFVFEEMPKGATLGLFLHDIFENLDFSKPHEYQAAIEQSGQYYSSIYNDEQKEKYLQLIRHSMEVTIENKVGEQFMLNQVTKERRLSELEFYFSLDRHKKSQITEVSPDIEFASDSEIEGMMHGFIDLFFEHEGRYYILDWKSNFLGNKPEDYNYDGLLAGIRGSNYTLQYYIYTVAMKRFLERKLSGFDFDRDFGGVIYLFLRGVRSNDNKTGVYFARPTLEEVDRLERLFYGLL